MDIETLKAKRVARGMSYQDVVDATERNGEAVSFSTVRRVFTAGPDDNFSPRTLRAITHVLGEDKPQEKPDRFRWAVWLSIALQVVSIVMDVIILSRG